MKLFNTTLADARLDTSELEGEPDRIGLLSAKATFRFDDSGRVELDADAPYALSLVDVPTPLGVLPSELEPRSDHRLEVILLGHAYAPGGRPARVLTVALSVGDHRQEIRVSGDRVWRGGPGERHISQPEPFVKMPLTHAHSFGGSATVLLDSKSPFAVRDLYNPHGKGFDPEPQLASFAGFKAPEGFPRLVDTARQLPNLERPDQLITRWEDAPEPCCWATQPFDVLVRIYREVQHSMQSPQAASAPKPDARLPTEAPPLGSAHHRAHPDWVIPIPAVAAKVRLENLLAAQPAFQFSLPDLCFAADYVIGERSGSRKLTPQTLVLLPDERRFYILYRLPFTFPFVPGEDRAFRLKTEPRWSRGEPD